MRKVKGYCTCGAPLYRTAEKCRKCYSALVTVNNETARSKQRERSRKYRATFKGKFKTLRECATKPVEINLEEYTAIVSIGICFYCHESLPVYGHGLDRKDNAHNYTKDNVVACCSNCNSIKSDKLTFDEMVLIMTRRRALRGLL